MKMRSVGVLGVGDILRGDDAFGPWVIEGLRARYELPPAVVADDFATPGLDLQPQLASYDAVIVVDTVRMEAPPGTLRRYTREDIVGHAPAGSRVSPHDPGLREALEALERARCGPSEVILLGVAPGDSSSGLELSPAVREAVPVAIQRVVAELVRLGARPRRLEGSGPGQAPGTDAGGS